jgi:hypothetical protein
LPKHQDTTVLLTVPLSLSKGRATSDDESDPDGTPGESTEKEIASSWALLISIILLIIAFFTSYMLQQKKVQAIHETVISIFAGELIRAPIGRPVLLLFQLTSIRRHDGRVGSTSEHRQLYKATRQLRLPDLL